MKLGIYTIHVHWKMLVIFLALAAIFITHQLSEYKYNFWAYIYSVGLIEVVLVLISMFFYIFWFCFLIEKDK